MNNGSRHTWRPVLFSLALLDALVLAGAFFLAYWLRISSGILYYGMEADLDTYIRLYVLSLPLILFIFASRKPEQFSIRFSTAVNTSSLKDT